MTSLSACAGLVPAVLLHGADDVLELRAGVGRCPVLADAPQRGAGLVEPPTQHQAVGRVGDERCADDDDDDGGRDEADAENRL